MEFSYMLMTDADSEIPFRWEDEYDIKTILMPYTLDGVERDFDLFRTMDIGDFYERMRQGAVVTTAQRNAEDFKAFWKPYLEAGQDVLYIGLSSQLSGTFNSACLAREEMLEKYPQRKIVLVDTLTISTPMALLMRQAARMRLAGKGLEEVAQWVEDNKQCVNALFTVDDLVYLKRGGRVTGAAAFFGTLLEIKPILYINPEGKLVPFEKVKGRKASLRRMVQLCSENVSDPEEAELFIMHADCEKDAQILESMIREKFTPKEVICQNVGPVIGAHAGPGTLAVVFMGKNREIK
jgi:DegV family protein with EDD domain